MTSVLTTAARFFIAPAEAAAFVPPRPRRSMAGVLAAGPDLPVAAGAVAASLRGEARARTALVCLWSGHHPPSLSAPAPAAPGAARLASKLARRGLVARACGAVCLVELPIETDAAMAAFRDAAAAADAPVVLALGRRHSALDGLLAGADRLVLAITAATDAALGDLAFEGLTSLGPPAQRIVLPRGLLARQVLRLGLSALTTHDAALRETPSTALQQSLS